MADQVNYLKTKKQKEYDITKVSLKTFNNGTELRMIIALERFSGTYILSVFIPTFCLIVAAEITLFIDSNHFEASIMVALTTNLVTYTIYGKCNIIQWFMKRVFYHFHILGGIANKLPEDSSIKMIEMWLLFVQLIQFVVFVILIIGESFIKFSKKKGQKKKRNIGRNKIQTISRIAIPTFTIVFCVTFFIVALSQKIKIDT